MAIDEAAAVLLDRRLVQRAEAAAEGKQRVVVERLVAKQQHKMLDPGAMDDGEVVIVDGAQVDAADFGAEGCAGRDDFDAGADGGGVAGWWHWRYLLRCRAR